MRHAIDSRERKLDDFFLRAKKQSIDDEITADLAKLGAVLVCGYVERCVEVIVLERLSNRAHERVIRFVKTFFKRGTNYDCETICQLLSRFDTDWDVRMRVELGRNDQWVTSLSSLYALRNSIAHGGDQNRGLAGVMALYDDCKLIVMAIEDATR
ncbi:HEPN domain-containing protein [Sphingomonas sp. SUN039]|uniref:HEPN domain-containing protein n=1 Tax=Sphingomonas sp. SUN039 TaxID=2937787 RepID=UPI002164BC4A|nr:HEPN domain-containing protein [Sphingomonas sp. SUN039]UVO53338.1 HEPN domain-containing protein [Sphingomonas sp. SUN039]